MDVTLALGRVAAEGAAATSAEQALWCITRAASAMLGDPAAALRPGAFRDPEPPGVGSAATVFLRMPDGRHHLIAAPIGFPDSQYHELVDYALGQPGEVARTRRPLLLRDAATNPSFFRILQSFIAGSSMLAPLLWQGEYLGALMCAQAARGSFSDTDLVALQAFAGLGSALFVAQGGPAWLAALDVSGRAVRRA
jgi:GAF domain-containing protein